MGIGQTTQQLYHLIAHSSLNLRQALGDLGCESARRVLIIPANLLAEQSAEIRNSDGCRLILAGFDPRRNLDIPHDECYASKADHYLDQPCHIAHEAAGVRRAKLVDDVAKQNNPLK